ncbi:MAG: metal-dependent hydrolase [Pleurocapsa sp. MO_192.B19]|nr:metal-dependent hydrolase [Pleurocapsa sp. MO_192.B19]
MGTGQPLPLGLAILGSQLPDLDTTTSTIGKIFFPISSWIEDRFPHRSVTHSLLATASISLVSLGVNYFFLHGSIKAVIALPLGHLLACFSDTFTKQGVQLFYPEPVWAISVSNPRRRLKTGGAGELWVLSISIASQCAERNRPPSIRNLSSQRWGNNSKSLSESGIERWHRPSL